MYIPVILTEESRLNGMIAAETHMDANGVLPMLEMQIRTARMYGMIKKAIRLFVALYALWCLLIWSSSDLEDRETQGRKWHALLARRYRVDYGRVIEAKDRIRELDRAVREFRRDTGKLPRDLKELTVNDRGIENWKGPYVKEIPPDPWKRPYIYRAPGEHGEFDILSFGADGQPGGDSVDGEVGNWNLDREIPYLY